MSTTILTNEQIESALISAGYVRADFKLTPQALANSRAIEQAVLQSPEIQALISAAQEFSDLYGWLWDTTEGGGFLSPDGVKRYDAAHHNLKVALCKITGRPLPIDPDEDDE